MCRRRCSPVPAGAPALQVPSRSSRELPATPRRMTARWQRPEQRARNSSDGSEAAAREHREASARFRETLGERRSQKPNARTFFLPHQTKRCAIYFYGLGGLRLLGYATKAVFTRRSSQGSRAPKQSHGSVLSPTDCPRTFCLRTSRRACPWRPHLLVPLLIRVTACRDLQSPRGVVAVCAKSLSGERVIEYQRWVSASAAATPPQKNRSGPPSQFHRVSP